MVVAPSVAVLGDGERDEVVRELLVARDSVADAELQVIEAIWDEVFLRKAPSSRNTWEHTVKIVLTEA